MPHPYSGRAYRARRLHADVVPSFIVKVVSEEKHNADEEVVVEEAVVETAETPAE